MARGKQLVWLQPVHFDHAGRPVDPDYGIDEGAEIGGGLPGRPERPGHLPGRPGRPVDPGWGWGGGEHPGNRPPGSWGGWGGRDPGYGVDEGAESGQLPVYPIDPESPDQGLPPEVPPGLPELPPGSVWPPLPPSVPPGKALAVIFISGVGSRWAVIDVPVRPERPTDPDYGVGEEHPDQSLPGGRPGRPPTAGQPLPPTRPGIPPRPGQGLPPSRPAPGQPLPTPPERQPKR
jgi:hypothetical protein